MPAKPDSPVSVFTIRIVDACNAADAGDDAQYRAVAAEIEHAGQFGALLDSWAAFLSWTAITGRELVADAPDEPAGWKAAATRLADAALVNDLDLTTHTATSIAASLELPELRAVVRRFADGMTHLINHAGGPENWYLTYTLHMHADVPDNYRRWAGHVGTVVATASSGHPQLARTYLNRLIRRDRTVLKYMVPVWMDVAVSVVGTQQLTILQLDDNGTPQALIDTAVNASREARVAHLIVRTIEAIRRRDKAAFDRAQDKFTKLSGRDLQIVVWMLVSTIAYRLAQARAETAAQNA